MPRYTHRSVWCFGGETADFHVTRVANNGVCVQVFPKREGDFLRAHEKFMGSKALSAEVSENVHEKSVLFSCCVHIFNTFSPRTSELMSQETVPNGGFFIFSLHYVIPAPTVWTQSSTTVMMFKTPQVTNTGSQSHNAARLFTIMRFIMRIPWFLIQYTKPPLSPLSPLSSPSLPHLCLFQNADWRWVSSYDVSKN